MHSVCANQTRRMKKIYIILIASILILSVTKGFAQVRQRTIDEIHLLLREKESRTPAQRKMDSRLLQASRERRGRQMAVGVNLAPARVNADANGRVPVDISADVTDDLIRKIEGLGGKIIYPSSEYRTIRAEINLSAAETIAAYPEVKFIQPAIRSMTVGSGNASRERLGNADANTDFVATINNSLSAKSLPGNNFSSRASRVRDQLKKYLLSHSASVPLLFSGTVNSEGDHAHRADDTRNTFGYEGQGIKIGVLSDSYNKTGGATADITNGNLPGTGNPLGNTAPVTVVQDFLLSGATDEGRAMLQIVHDIAPKAQLFFATANVSEAGFANNIKTLQATYHCDIIIDDVFYFDEPVFQDGIIAQAVNTVTNAGVLYFSSAGNEGSLAKNSASYFEGDFNDAGSPAFTFPGGTKSGTIHNFGSVGTPVNGDIITTIGNRYTLNWSDPLGGSGNDYDLFLVSFNGTVMSQSTNIQSGTQNPYEEISPPSLSPGDRLVVFRKAGAQARAFAINTVRGILTVATTGQTHGHSSAADAFSVAAAPAYRAFGTGAPTGPYPGVYTTSNNVEVFSSDGPRRIFYNPDSTQVTPGNLLFGSNGGTVRNKPDITAADGVSTTLPSNSGLNPFFGTSAAAPHAGAIAALLKSANPSLTISNIRTILTSTALDIESGGYDINSGYGIIQAYQAMQAVNPTNISNISLGTVTATEGSFSNSNGVIEPGELGKLVIQLNNSSLVTATGVTAVISTTTLGVTITQSSTSYGSIAASGNASNTITPFTFGVSSAVGCGTVINFIITVSFGGGGISPQSYSFSVTAGKQPGANISASLGSPATGTSFTSTTGNQTGRLFRGTPVSACGSTKSNPGLGSTTTGSRTYDSYIFTNTNATSQCVTVTMNAANGANLYLVAYNNTGFVPATPNTNYLADAGSVSNASQSLSFTATAGQSFTVVVHELNPATAAGSLYTLNVSLGNCTVAPSCTPVTITTASISNGVLSSAYNQSFAASGGSSSGTYIYAITGGSLPTGLGLSGNTISGIPLISQIGNYPLTITASDPAGCPVGSKNYTLLITPRAVTATAGTPQTTSPGSVFATALQVTVLDGNNNPVPNAVVSFTAPASGATGTFTGNLSSATIITNSNGIATAPVITANATVGSYTVTATAGSLTTNFALTNANCSLNCPGNITVNNDAGQCGAVVNFGAITSTCGTVTATPASGSFFSIGTTIVTITSSGALTCTFTVKVNDTQAPTINCPANIVTTTNTNQCGAIVNFTLPTVTDNCPGATVTANPVSGSFFPKGSTTVTLTATDAANNTSTCTFTVTVNDIQKPTITCPSNISVNNQAGQCGATVNFTTPTTSDNCPGVTVVSVPASGSFFQTGVTTVTSTATDASGNTSTCTFTVTVNDIEKPVISSCPSNITVNNDAGQCGAVVNFTLPVVSDNCSGATITASPASGSFFAKGTTTVTCTANDASNNTSTCTFTITVNDKEAPTINCPSNIVTNTDANQCGAVVNFNLPTATDNCSGVVTVTASAASGSFFQKGITIVILTARDAANNISTCTFTVKDCPAVAVKLNDCDAFDTEPASAK